MDDQLRPIHVRAIPAALEKARVYRLLNEPEQAESICLDILNVEPKNTAALKMLILALTDQFPTRSGSVKRAKTRLTELESEYDQLYYGGLVFEREARAQLAKGVSAAFAYDLFVNAMALYEQAEALGSAEDDEPVLRRNSCIRTIRAEQLEPLEHADETHLE